MNKIFDLQGKMAIWCDANFYQTTNNALCHIMILVFRNSLQKVCSTEQRKELEELYITYHSLKAGQHMHAHQN